MPILLSYQPDDVSNRLLSVLPDRSREVLTSRLGLSGGLDSQTLEAIGKKHGVTRERVRQIENFALNSIRKSDQYKAEQKAFQELRDAMYTSGGVVEEESFLRELAASMKQSRKKTRQENHILLLLLLGEEFHRFKEDKHFRHRWAMDKNLADEVHKSLHDLHKGLTQEHLFTEEEIIQMLLEKVRSVPKEHQNKDAAARWLSLSKRVGKNPLNDWGLSESPNIHVRGIRDYAYLVLRKSGKPLHFTEIAKRIKDDFGKKAHTATCHNELIKDERFVLVGRGLYGLSEWGYSDGVVREVIRNVLLKNGPMDKDSIVEQVLKERFVKENTVLVNLQNDEHFSRTSDGRYSTK